MAFTSLEDARNKVTDPAIDETSIVLYANNSLLDSTTIFYTNEQLTAVASAGNYVLPSPQFKSYYITIGSDGKIVGTKQNLLLSTTDTSWVDDSIMQFIQGIQIPSSNFGNWDYGTLMSIDSSNRLTDALWSSIPEGQEKRWQIDYGPYRTDALTNIDLSDMKGYELKITIGRWYGNTWPNGDFLPGFQGSNFTTPIVHIASDPNRETSVGPLNYYFRPDYFYPKGTFEYESSFRRMPNYLPIYDENGIKKQFQTTHNPLLDAVVKDSGGMNPWISRTFRDSTRGYKGETLLNPIYLKNFVPGTPSNPGYYMRREENGSASENILQVVPYANRHIFNGDTWIRGASAFARNIPYESVTMGNTDVSYVNALLLSLNVLGSERDVWTYNVVGVGTLTYAQINPYQWTTIPYEGSYSDRAPATGFLGFFNPNGSSINPNNESHAAQVQFDFEYVATYGRDSFDVGNIYQLLWDNCKAWSISNNWSSAGGVIPNLSNYAEGLYKTEYYGVPGSGWIDVLDKTVAQAKATILFDDYKNYYLNGTKPYTSVAYHKFYQAAIRAYNLFFISNYVTMNQPYYYFYAFVHNYDITKKLISQFLPANDANQKRVMGYCWNFQEPNYSDFYFARIGIQNGQMQTYRPNVAPSFNQSIAVWSMAYADGLYMWDNTPSTIGGEYNHENYSNDVSMVYYWGFLTTLNNGMFDWIHVGIWQVMQNKDIVGATTSWQKPEIYWNGAWTSNTDANSSNIPVMLAQAKAPISAFKLSGDGTQALLIITYPYSNGYTKSTHKIRLPGVTGTPEFNVNTWGQYTSVIRINLI
jgi:hypothetical protein